MLAVYLFFSIENLLGSRYVLGFSLSLNHIGHYGEPYRLIPIIHTSRGSGTEPGHNVMV